MNFRKLYVLLAVLISLSAIMLPTQSLAQWSGTYGNSWLAGKYGPNWLKIGVTQKGIHKVTLTGDFINKATKLHLYHRGVEVPLISASNTEIEFYGVPNDGASDALLYRPYNPVRPNPYFSWFSNESAYFLTFISADVNNLVTQQSVIATSGTADPYHIQKDLTVYSDEYTHDETTNLVYFSLDQSYYDETKSMTGGLQFKLGAKGNPTYSLGFNLKNLIIDNNRKPVVDVLFSGRTTSTTPVQISAGKTTASLRVLPDAVEFTNFVQYSKQFTLQATGDPATSDVDASGNGVFQAQSTKITNSASTTGGFSVSYIQLVYPQSFDMLNTPSKVFNLLPVTVSNTSSRIAITNAPANARIYDITNPESPKQISGSYSGSTLTVMVERAEANKELQLLVSASSVGVAGNKVTSVIFTEYNPASSDYLIITNGTLSVAADKFAVYRASTAGGSYNTLTVKIKDIYNQFNYGEPSPVAIRRFVDYMVHGLARDKHNLLLVGPSTTFPSRVTKELPDEVPSVGYPGSDVLLVEGLTPGSAEIPSIPVGRISATTETQVDAYLAKVRYL